MEQGSHFPNDGRGKRSIKRHPETDSLRIHRECCRNLACRKNTGITFGQYKIGRIPLKLCFSTFHTEPYKLFMRNESVFTCIENSTSGERNPGAACNGQTAGLMPAFHHQSIRSGFDSLKEIRFHLCFPPNITLTDMISICTIYDNVNRKSGSFFNFTTICIICTEE